MLKNLFASLAILGCTIGFVLAEEVKGKITKIDGNKITVEYKDKDKKEKATKTFEAAANVKVCKKEGKDKLEIAGGLKAEPLQNLGNKGLDAMLNVDGGKVTEIVVQTPKKK